MAKKNFTVTGILGLIFIVFTAIVVNVDVKEIGPQDTSVGLATVNASVKDFIGYSDFFYKLTQLLGYLALLVAGYFALIGLLQLIKRKDLKRVDIDIYVLGGFYVCVGIAYVFFEKFIVNYRPMIMDGELEASYPSSHTMMAVAIFITAIIQFHSRVKNKDLLKILDIVFIALTLIMIVGRILSGVHWFTDIIGGVLLSVTLVMLYYSVVSELKLRTKILK